jgi:hypothetical protein
MNKRNYNALVTTSEGTVNYELTFEHHPSVKEVLETLHTAVQKKNELAVPLLVNIQRDVHASGQEQQLFNESTIFHYGRDGAWLRIYCPLYTNES